MSPRVYLAGPDVFYPNHAEIFAKRRTVCRRFGLEPLVPIDNKATTSVEIYQANVKLLDGCDAIIANITPFRGPHCDVGTAWEIGYAVARGAAVFAFSEAVGSLLDRVLGGTALSGRDASGMLVEDFGLPENLMIVEGLVGRIVHSTFESAARAAAGYFVNVRER